ncbi:SDR family NAD(P)-dependent oxidoreductase [Herbiconiux ginsengi]|uniref:3-oxoacyl-[acyl-carrier protein] reductase n=1 Tax=Herbiconiux ginsengi TaxID=381665 RepID=A0A1H3TFL8_9MICO|nr:SDR family NAD(P)-dependent oxidoreductase [Herbiconiux ginsengi]SDZ49026.1 3-oxoacyl-[acyl-carrier protein] reductase [Herbiconiux ginsengi]
MTSESRGNVEGHVAMVTGGASGIGRATALMLAREGADIVVCDLNAEGGESLVAEVEALGRRAVAIPTDSTDEGQVAWLVAAGLDRLGKIDILVNNAGIVTTDRTVDLEKAAWDRVVAVHLGSMFVATKAVLADMRTRRWGRIVNVTSRAAHRGRIGNGPYAAAKGGMLAYGRVLAMETAEWGITVNNVAPGNTLTPMLASVFPTPESQADEARSSGHITVPTRLIDADEIAGAVLYFCGPYSDQTTGTTLHVNGGSFMA